MCIEPTEEDLITIHHELGHDFYFQSYFKLPILFQQGANDGFHEGIGDTLALAVTPAYLKGLGLLDKVPNDEKGELNVLFKMALDKVAFLPFGKLIDQWRWDVFSGKTKAADYNKAWWALRLKYQGVAPPVARTEDDFDPGAKYHVPANVPYVRYFLARIYQFQFYRALCRAAGHKGSLHTCSFFGSKAAGERLQAMLKMGASRPWPEAMKAISGEDKADAGALLEYFAAARRVAQRAEQRGDVRMVNESYDGAASGPEPRRRFAPSIGMVAGKAAAMVVFAGALAACEPAARGPLAVVSGKAAEHLRAGAKSYGGAVGAAAASPLENDVFKAFDFGLRPDVKPLLVHEPALDLVARVVSESFFKTEQHTTPFVAQWMAWRAGSFALVDQMHIQDRGKVGFHRDARLDDIGPALDRDATKFGESIAPRAGAFGVAREVGSLSRTAQAIVVGREPVVVEPLAKSYQLDEQATLNIKSLNGYTKPVLYLDVGNGVGKVKVATDGGGGASVTFPVSSRPGHVLIELRASPPQSPEIQQTVLLVPLYAGVPEPESLGDFLGPRRPDPDPARTAAALRAAYDAARAGAMQGNLVEDAPLQRAVEGWAQAIALGAPWTVANASIELQPILRGRKFLVQTTSLRAPGDFSDYVTQRLMSPYAKSAYLAPGAAFASSAVGRPQGGVEVVECVLWVDQPL